jgi:tetratricopeptide (TPR) repeat protein
MKKLFFAALFCVLVAVWCFGQTNFTMGENLFMHNKPDEAAAYLDKAIAEDPAHVMAFLYLGIVYEQLDRAGDAINIYRQILDHAGDLTANVANNLGNAYFTMGSNAEAEASYTRALAADRTYAPAYLGRANSRMKAGSIPGAVADYEQYLQLAPNTPQKETIERLLAYIRTEIAETGQQPLFNKVSESPRSVTDMGQNLFEEEEDYE